MSDAIGADFDLLKSPALNNAKTAAQGVSDKFESTAGVLSEQLTHVHARSDIDKQVQTLVPQQLTLVRNTLQAVTNLSTMDEGAVRDMTDIFQQSEEEAGDQVNSAVNGRRF